MSAAAWLGASGLLVCEVVFERAPDRTAITAALPQARLAWTDDTHLSLSWASPPAALTIPAGLAASRGSVLDGPLQLSLRGLQAGQLRRATVPAASPAPAGLRVTLWTDGTAASHASTQAHAAAAAILSPTGWQVEAGGGLSGSPDAVTLAAAAAAHRPVWPILANDDAGSTGTDQLLNSATAETALIGAVVAQVRSLHLGGVNLDFESVPGNDPERPDRLRRPALHRPPRGRCGTLHRCRPSPGQGGERRLRRLRRSRPGRGRRLPGGDGL